MRIETKHMLDETDVREAIVSWLERCHDINVLQTDLKFDIVDSNGQDYGNYDPAYIRGVTF